MSRNVENSPCPLSIPVPTLLRVSFLSTKYWPAEGAFVGGIGAASREKKNYIISPFNVLRREGLICLLTLFHSQECSMSDFPCSLTRKCNHGYGMENLAFHSLLRWKVIDTANSHSSNISLNWLGECNLNWSTKKGGRPISAIVDLEAFDSEMVVCVGVMIRNCLSCQHWNSR